MLIAYLDEFGHIGPFISRQHPKYNDHPVFGYAGFVLPVDAVRPFGGFFEFTKEKLLGWEIERAGVHPRRWEKKGASLLTAGNRRYASEIDHSLQRLTQRLHREGGHPVYFGQVKPLGGPDDVHESAADRSGHMLINAVRKLAQYADRQDERIMIFLDSVDTAPRLEAVQRLGGYIYKAVEPELKRVVEVPMQLNSKHYGNVQFADWVAAVVTRAADFHLSPNPEFSWAPDVFRKTIGPDRCEVGSYIELAYGVPHRARMYGRQLCSPTVWSPPADTRRAQRTRKKYPPRPAGGSHTVEESAPELRAFYESLKRG